jgi:ABC-2 type transport system ATP-binding protein
VAPSAIEVSGLTKHCGELEAVAGVRFEVTAGEVFCLLVLNGAGKTTRRRFSRATGRAGRAR